MAKTSTNIPVPTQDSSDNDSIRDVVGNKTDTTAGDSIISLLKDIPTSNNTVFHKGKYQIKNENANAGSVTIFQNVSVPEMINKITITNIGTGQITADLTDITCTIEIFGVGEIEIIDSTAGARANLLDIGDTVTWEGTVIMAGTGKAIKLNYNGTGATVTHLTIGVEYTALTSSATL